MAGHGCPGVSEAKLSIAGIYDQVKCSHLVSCYKDCAGAHAHHNLASGFSAILVSVPLVLNLKQANTVAHAAAHGSMPTPLPRGRYSPGGSVPRGAWRGGGGVGVSQVGVHLLCKGPSLGREEGLLGREGCPQLLGGIILNDPSPFACHRVQTKQVTVAALMGLSSNEILIVVHIFVTRLMKY